MAPVVLAFSGRIASGKTTVGRRVAESQGFLFASFGDTVRKEARRRGLDANSREVLQGLGSELINGGWLSFCNAVLEDAGWTAARGLVVDGIRHIEALETIRGLVSPMPVYSVYVHVDDRTRDDRLRQRNTDKEQSPSQIDRHETESQVGTILAYNADITIDGTLPPEEIGRQISVWLEAHVRSQ